MDIYDTQYTRLCVHVMFSYFTYYLQSFVDPDHVIAVYIIFTMEFWFFFTKNNLMLLAPFFALQTMILFRITGIALAMGFAFCAFFGTHKVIIKTYLLTLSCLIVFGNYYIDHKTPGERFA